MGWWITLGIVTLLAILPLGASLQYDADGFLVRLIIGPVKVTLFPKSGKENKPEKQKEEPKKETPDKAEEKKTPSAPAEAKPKSPDQKPEVSPEPEKAETKEGGPITDFLPLVKTLLDMLGAFRRRLRVNLLEIKVIMAGDDPCDLAVNYGRAWAAVGNLQPQLERIFVIKKRKIDVECDFCGSVTKIIARLDLTINLGRLLATVVVYGIKALIQFLKINKKRKGGAAK